MENKTLAEKSISSLSHSVMCKNCKSTKYFKHVCHFIPTRAKYKGRSRERYIFGCCRKSSFPHHCLGLHFLGRSLLAPCWSWSQEEFSYVVGIIMHCIWWGFRGGPKMMTLFQWESLKIISSRWGDYDFFLRDHFQTLPFARCRDFLARYRSAPHSHRPLAPWMSTSTSM